MSFFFQYLRDKWRVFAAFFLFFALFLIAFYLFRVPPEAVLYPSVLCLLIGAVFLFSDYRKQRRKHILLQKLKSASLLTVLLPDAGGLIERDYREILSRLQEETKAIREAKAAKQSDAADYYTTWVHQIKTPIASMKLALQGEDTALSRRLSSELLRVEQYVEMVLAYQRLEPGSNDYLIAEHSLDRIARQAVKKFAADFIGRRLTMQYEIGEEKILTDEKWFSFLLEQLLSNAVKYTRPGGVIRLYTENDRTVCLSDNGIGIAKEDLPRIFERGYTGFNGRKDKSASGIGLYLCKRVCDKLAIAITVLSSPGEGTTVRLVLPDTHAEIE